MISRDDIEAFTADDIEAVQISDRVSARVRRGIVSEREATTAEWLAVLRGYELFRDMSFHLMRQQQEAARSAMAVYDRAGRETG